MNEKYSGSDWVATHTKKNLSPLGKMVADILGNTFQGIYHLDEKMIKKVDWTAPGCIEIPLQRCLASYDNCDLTLLIVLCFDNMIRLSIAPRTFNLLTLRFNRRSKRDGKIFERLPELNALIDDLRTRYALCKAGKRCVAITTGLPLAKVMRQSPFDDQTIKKRTKFTRRKR